MKPFIAIIGSRNSGKSTIIRSLTGAKFGQFIGTIQDITTGREIEVIGSSPQESVLSLAELRKIIRKAASNSNCQGVVCALQPTLPTKRLSMEQVLKEAAASGMAVHAYILDPEYGGSTGHATAVAARLRSAGFSSRTLDGRRFAHINAATVNGHTRIAA